MQVEDITVHIRPYEPEDRNFILKTWMRSFRGYYSKTPDGLYYANQQDLIDRIFERPTARCVVACDTSDPGFIFSFFVGETFVTADPREPLIIHYGFTKLSYREQGMATYCLQALGWNEGRTVHVTHWTKHCRENADKYRLVHNDFFLRGYDHGRFELHNARRIQPDSVPAVGPVPGVEPR